MVDAAAIAARAETATPGPWRFGEPRSFRGHFPIRSGGYDPGVNLGLVTDRADAEFIAHARQDIPTLLAALATAEERAENAERSERTNRWYVGDEPMLRAIVDAQSEYIEVLEEAHGAAAGFMHVHGQHDAPELVERGKQLRERIAAIAANYSKATGPQAAEKSENAPVGATGEGS